MKFAPQRRRAAEADRYERQRRRECRQRTPQRDPQRRRDRRRLRDPIAMYAASECPITPVISASRYGASGGY